MKQKQIVKRFRDRLIHPLTVKPSFSLSLMISIPIVCNSLATVALIEYFSSAKSQSSLGIGVERNSAKGGKTPLSNRENTPQNNSLPQNLTLLLLTILSSIATCILLTLSLDKQIKLLQIKTAKGEETAGNIDTSNSKTQQRSPDEVRKELDFPIDNNPYSWLADMGHELRSPLNAILGFAQIMEQEQATDSSVLDNVAIINRSGERLLSIVNNIVDLAKIETHRLTLENNEIDLYAWLERLEQNMKLQAHSQGWQFSLKRQPNLPHYVRLDEKRLRQTLCNLVNHCCDCSTLESEIGIEVASESISESDTKAERSGSASKHKLKFSIFNPSIEIERSPQQSAGNSLNLLLSLKLARLAGGNFTVRRHSPQLGIVFEFVIEVASAVAEDVRVQSVPRKVIGLKSSQTEYRILIVDDSKINRLIMSQLLEPVGFKVREAANGREAVDVWSDWQPHMIWMDLRMPIMNGFEATELIKSSSPKETPIVALSASSLEDERSQLNAVGCDDFVGKPFAENIIFEKIAQYLGVRYIYEAAKPIPKSFRLTAETLRVMPESWLERVEHAAAMLDRTLLTQLLQEIPLEHAELKNALQQQIDNFDFDKITSLINNLNNP